MSANYFKTYIVPVKRTVTEYFEVRARNPGEAMDKVENSSSGINPIDVVEGDAEVDYHGIQEKVHAGT